MKTHARFQVKVAEETLLPCTHLVPQLSITMANHTVTKYFFIMDLDDMEVILGIQWMETLDENTQSFKWMDFTLWSMERRLFSAEWKMNVKRKYLQIGWR